MDATAYTGGAIKPVDALWVLFQSQPKAVRKAFMERVIAEDVNAERLRKRCAVKQSLAQALSELDESQRSGQVLPDARTLFK